MTPLRLHNPVLSNQNLESIDNEEDKIKIDLGKRADSLANSFFKKRKENTESPSKSGKRNLTELIPETGVAKSFRASNSPLKEARFPQLEPKEFEIDEYPYILTTEVGHQTALEELRSQPPTQEGFYLGFAFEFNYHILAERSVKFAWICDINKRMHKFYLFIATTIIKIENKDNFIKALKTELINNSQEYFDCSDEFLVNTIIDHFLNLEYSWLHSEEKFQKIKNLYLNHQISHLNLNLIKDSSFFAELKLWADSQKTPFDVIYLSNIPEWLFRQSSGDQEMITKMKANLLKIITPETIVIDAKQIEREKGAPEIRINRGIANAQSFPSFEPDRRPKILSRMRGRAIDYELMV